MTLTSPYSDADTPGLVIAAPASGSGKTTVSLALMRAFTRRGLKIAPAKVGPDYIDPEFHRLACGRGSINLDGWAMRMETRMRLLNHLDGEADLILAEGVMGLFDGASDGTGSTGDLARLAGWPVILVVDVKGQSASAAAVVRGFMHHDTLVWVAGVIFNRVGSDRHKSMIADAMAASELDIPVLGYLPRRGDLALESRHLGLVQAQEVTDIDALLDRAADWMEDNADLDLIQATAEKGRHFHAIPATRNTLRPPGQRVAVAQDTAFAFAYPHLLDNWRFLGADILPFSPLADEAPDPSADSVYLPGGYPELFAGTLAGNSQFLDGLRGFADQDRVIFGECGGYMVLGDGLIDADGTRHAMAGLLRLETSFADRKLHLGYRRVEVSSPTAPWASGYRFRGHEFHYASVLKEEGDPLFLYWDSANPSDLATEATGISGLTRGRTAGSFIHLIDEAP